VIPAAAQHATYASDRGAAAPDFEHSLAFAGLAVTNVTASPLADALRDRYVVERELGRGGMATVYLARDLKHDRLVALKVLGASPSPTSRCTTCDTRLAFTAPGQAYLLPACRS
jgi:hypothetical protein